MNKVIELLKESLVDDDNFKGERTLNASEIMEMQNEVPIAISGAFNDDEVPVYSYLKELTTFRPAMHNAVNPLQNQTTNNNPSLQTAMENSSIQRPCENITAYYSENILSQIPNLNYLSNTYFGKTNNSTLPQEQQEGRPKKKRIRKSNSSNLSQEQQEGRPKKGRKRKYPLQNRYIRKMACIQNKEYITARGKIRKQREFKKFTCKCKCFESIGEDALKKEFNNFYNVESHDAQRALICAMVTEVPIKRRRTKGSEKKKQSREYKICGKKVCKAFFIQTFKISSCKVDRALQKLKSPEGIRDCRGVGGGKNKFPESKVQEVIDHIKKFPRYIAHRRDETKAELLPPDTTLPKMYSLYKEQVDKPVSLSSYKKLFFTKFNLKMKKLTKDACNAHLQNQTTTNNTSSQVIVERPSENISYYSENVLSQIPNSNCLPNGELEKTNNSTLLQEPQDGRPKKGRKRKYPHQNRYIRKMACIQNKEYVTQKGKIQKPKEFKQFICKCKCYESIGEEVLKKEFSNFYSVESHDAQRALICEMVTEVPIKRKRAKGSEKKKQSREYKICGKKVCKAFFLQTFRISSCKVDRALKKLKTIEGVRDCRGIGGGKNKFPESKVQEVVDHINKFPRYIYHYRTDQTKVEFLSPDLTLPKMYSLYKEVVDKPVSLSSYKKIFFTKFNLKIKEKHTPCVTV